MDSTSLNLCTFYVNITLAIVQSLTLLALVFYVVKTWQIATATKLAAVTYGRLILDNALHYTNTSIALAGVPPMVYNVTVTYTGGL